MEAYNPHLGYETEVIQNNMKAVHAVANKFRLVIGNGLDYDDLVSIGTLGLIEAFRNYDPTRFNGKVTAFSTYAFPMIRWSIQKYLRSKRYAVRVPSKIIDRLALIRKQGWVDDPAEEIVLKTGWKMADVQDLLKHLEGWSVSSVDQVISQDDKDLTMLDMLPSVADYSGIHVEEFLRILSPTERTIVMMRMEGSTQSEIGKHVHKSQVLVSRLLNQIKDKYTRYQSGELTREESIVSNKIRESQMSSIEWFVDEKTNYSPTIGVNSFGIHVNRRAAEMIKCTAGQCLSVGFDSATNRLVIKRGDNGLKLRKWDKSGGLQMVNKRLVSWLQQKTVERKRYVLHESQGTYYIELESHA
ncbi:sigma-70 family RNA polymerase sigma factor [Paenibacillus alvei]|uniref:sigma-70 family RNA polymerase sigma factor n=1 Tax=Paenibacillus alvei TaxID=44250 RepID=UPI0022810437|nr:sigma-70 family RNA polymerase sigma factor [Paenibacillus alvei]MCY9733138.1 sigma-70 family RNA polymerase sigma factor [Paenibacillus alvei]